MFLASLASLNILGLLWLVAYVVFSSYHYPTLIGLVNFLSLHCTSGSFGTTVAISEVYFGNDERVDGSKPQNHPEYDAVVDCADDAPCVFHPTQKA